MDFLKVRDCCREILNKATRVHDHCTSPKSLFITDANSWIKPTTHFCGVFFCLHKTNVYPNKNTHFYHTCYIYTQHCTRLDTETLTKTCSDTHTHTHTHRRVLEGEMMRRSIIGCQQRLIEYENNILTILVRLTHTNVHTPGTNTMSTIDRFSWLV